jgi:hypothetical protein
MKFVDARRDTRNLRTRKMFMNRQREDSSGLLLGDRERPRLLAQVPCRRL